MPAPFARAQLDIDAPIGQVWETLTALDAYPEWNPFVVRVDGASRPVVGTPLMLRVRWAGGGRFSSGEHVTRVEPPGTQAVLAWRYTGLLPAIRGVRAERTQTLTVLSAGRTRYESVEVFQGFLVAFLPLADVVDGFERMAAALKARCEQPGA